MALLETYSLSATIGSRTLFDHLNLTIQAGQNWAVLGPNGCGKSTLLHTLAGLTEPSNGSVSLSGKPLTTWTHKQRSIMLGILFQKEDTYFPATILETVLTGRHPHVLKRGLRALLDWEENEDIKIAEKALQEVDLLQMKNRIITTLSGGEWRRVMIAALLAQNTNINLYDEIANHLDLNYQQKILRLVTNRISEGNRANIFVLQDINQATRFCEYGLMLFDNGQHIAGPMREIISVNTLEELYHCPFTSVSHQDRDLYLPA